MNVWEVLLTINTLFGILACYYYSRIKGEILIGDLFTLFLILVFGSVTFWSYLYDTYVDEFQTIFGHIKNLNKKPLWRSRSTIAKEVLFGENKK